MIAEKIKKYIENNQQLDYPKKHNWASDANKCKRALWYSMHGIDKTDPPEPKMDQRFKAGSAFEKAIIQDLYKMGILVSGDIPEEGIKQERIEIKINGAKISGRPDAIIKQEVELDINHPKFGKIKKGIAEIPLEIKSFYSRYQIKDFQDDKPRDTHVAQLAFYMYALDKDIGILYYGDVTGREKPFEFICHKEDEYKFRCGKTKVDLDEITKGWGELKELENPPEPEFQYKYPITKDLVDEFSKTNIGRARQGKKVLGDWNCQYCPYQAHCLKKQGINVGYSDKELKKLKEITTGYTVKKKSKIK